MTVRKRKRHAPEFKAQVALEAYRDNKTINPLASEHGVAAIQISQWKRQLLKQVPELFGRTAPDIDVVVQTHPGSAPDPYHQPITDGKYRRKHSSPALLFLFTEDITICICAKNELFAV